MCSRRTLPALRVEQDTIQEALAVIQARGNGDVSSQVTCGA